MFFPSIVLHPPFGQESAAAKRGVMLLKPPSPGIESRKGRFYVAVDIEKQKFWDSVGGTQKYTAEYKKYTAEYKIDRKEK